MVAKEHSLTSLVAALSHRGSQMCSATISTHSQLCLPMRFKGEHNPSLSSHGALDSQAATLEHRSEKPGTTAAAPASAALRLMVKRLWICEFVRHWP